MPNIFPTFKTAFVDGFQIAKLAFAKSIGSAEDPNEPDLDQLILADFSRPNIGATSGAIVYDVNGKLTEVAANFPDWSKKPGDNCYKVLMRPQLANLITSSDPEEAYWGGANRIISAEAWSCGLFENKARIDGSVSSSQLLSLNQILIDGQTYTFAAIIRRGDNAPIVDSTGYYIGNNHSGSTFVKSISLGNGEYMVVLKQTQTSGSNKNFAVRQLTGEYATIGTYIEVTALSVFLGDVAEDLLPTDLLRTTGAALTRSANQIDLSDLITKGLFGAGGVFSMRLKVTNYSSGPINGDNAIVFKNAANTNILALWGLDAGFTSYDMVSLNYVNLPIQLTDLIITFNGQDLKVYDNTGLRSSYSFAASHIITRVLISSGDNKFELSTKDLAFESVVISEAEAIEILS